MSFSLRTGKGQRIAFIITGRKGAGFGREQEIGFLGRPVCRNGERGVI